jgi:hypothetical protein
MNNINDNNFNIPKEIILLIAIFYITVFYVIFGIYVITLLDEYSVTSLFMHADDKHDSFFISVLELAGIVGITACIAYVGKILIESIPFPLDGLYGFNYIEFIEKNTGHVLFIFLFGFSAIIFNKMEQIKDKLNMVKSVSFVK